MIHEEPKKKIVVEVSDFLRSADSVALRFKSEEIFNGIRDLSAIGDIDFQGILCSIGNLVDTYNGDISAVRRYCHLLILLSLNLDSARIYRSDSNE